MIHRVPRETDLNRALDQAAGLTTLPAAGKVWWVDDDDLIRDEKLRLVDPHQALCRIRELQITALAVTRRTALPRVVYIAFGLALASCVYNAIVWGIS
jgi:hypothetical protein